MRSAECGVRNVECRMPNAKCQMRLEIEATHEPSPALNLNLNPNPNRRGEIKIKIKIKIMSRTPGFMAPMRVHSRWKLPMNLPPLVGADVRRLTSILDCRFSNAECRMPNAELRMSGFMVPMRLFVCGLFWTRAWDVDD